MKLRVLYAVWIALFLFLLLNTTSTQAQTPETQADFDLGIDVLFIVDQSGSMRDGPINRPGEPRLPATDPEGLSIDAVRDGFAPIFDRILQRQLARGNAGLLEENYRFGLILFGSEVVEALPMTRIEAITDPATNLQTPNIADQFPGAAINLGDTSFSRAFSLACTMLGSSSDCNEPFPADRQRFIVLLTDGQPSIQGAPAVIESLYSNTNPGPYFDRLRQTYGNLFRNAELWVLGIDKRNQFWANNVAEWEQIAPQRTQRLESERDVSRVFQDIADKMLASGNEFERGDCNATAAISVPPYLASMTLILNYKDTDSRAEFRTPSGVPLSPPQPGGSPATDTAPNQVTLYNRTRLSEVFTILRPEPGNWACTLVGTGVVPEYRKREGSFAIAELRPATPDGQLASTCSEFGLTVSYRDAKGKVLQQVDAFPLYQEAVVQFHDGRSEQVNLSLVPGRTDLWKSERTMLPDNQGGAYTVTVAVRLDPAATPIFTGTGQVIIPPDYPCALRVVQPTAQQELALSDFYWPWEAWYPDVPPGRLLPAEVAIALERTDGRTADNNVFLQPLTEIVTATIHRPDGERVAADLNYDTDFLEAKVPGQTLDRIGTYTLTVELAGTTRDNLPYSLSAAPVTFVRKLPEQVLLAQQIAFGVIVGMFLAFSGALMWFAYIVTPPYPTGRLIIETRQSDGSWDDGSRYYQVRAPKFRLFGLIPTKYPYITNLPASTGIKYIKVSRIGNGRREGVRAKVVPRKGSTLKKTDKTFDHSGAPQTISSDVRIRYEKGNIIGGQ